MNVFVLSDTHSPEQCAPQPFEIEEHLEDLLAANLSLIGDLTPLGRQINTGTGDKRIDILAIDSEGAICVIELKRGVVGSDVLQQVLGYVSWVRHNPSAIESLWLKKNDKPADLEIEFAKLNVRSIIAGSQVTPSVLKDSDLLNFNVEFLEINRYRTGDSTLVTVRRLSPALLKPPSVPKGTGTYEDDYYLKQKFNADSVKRFFLFVQSCEEWLVSRGLALETKRNKNYVSFKLGSRIVFGLTWQNSKDFAFLFKLPENQARQIGSELITGYADGFKEAYSRVPATSESIGPWQNLLEACVERWIGNSTSSSE